MYVTCRSDDVVIGIRMTVGCTLCPYVTMFLSCSRYGTVSNPICSVAAVDIERLPIGFERLQSILNGCSRY